MTIKQERMAERIRQVMSELLMREVADPRIQSVTVTKVKVDPEIMFARIYVNALGDESRRREVMSGLKRASGFLRREMAKRIRIAVCTGDSFHLGRKDWHRQIKLNSY